MSGVEPAIPSGFDIFINLDVEVDQHDEGYDAQHDQPAPVEVRGVDGRGPHGRGLEGHVVVDGLVGHRVQLVVINNLSLKEPESTNRFNVRFFND